VTRVKFLANSVLSKTKKAGGSLLF